ncbi:MAG: hypothetical protein O2964_08135 [Verrucomicrobia bacterium]|nr:hypothetical protein [Verrucomicrobiota bacterium]
MLQIYERGVVQSGGISTHPDRKCNGVSAQRNGHLNASPCSRTRGSGSLPLTDATLMEEYCPIVPACYGVSIFSFRWDQLFEELKDHWDEKHYWMGILELEKLKDKKVMKNVWLLFCVVATFSVSAGTIRVIEDFEYASEDDLLLHYEPSTGAVPSLSTDVADGSGGETSMKIDLSFPSGAWVTQTVTGPLLDEVFSIEPEQYISFRLKGDPAFESADFRNIYLYVYDDWGDFARWGAEVPITDGWQVINFGGGDYQFPWNASGEIDMTFLSKIAIFQYGSQAAIDPYEATIYIDDIEIRDEPLIDFAAPSASRSVIDDFEGYATSEALREYYTYENSWHPATTVASIESPAPEGENCLRLDINFPEGQYPWGSVRSPILEPFSLPDDGVITLKMKGDAGLSKVADAGTNFWLSFYDAAGNRMNYITDIAPVISSEWTTLTIAMEDFGDTSTIDTGNLVQWRILVEGWAEPNPALSGTFFVDDIRVSTQPELRPVLEATREGQQVRIRMSQLTPGSEYELAKSENLTDWAIVTTIAADADTADHLVDADQKMACYQLIEKP